LRPDIVILFPTQQQINEKLTYTEDRCDEIETEIKKELPKVGVKRVALDLTDPTDYHQILACLNARIEEVKEQYKKSDVEYLLNVSSSTPQIQASFLILVSSQRLNAKVYQVRDPKYVEAGQEHIREVDVQFIEEENQINRARIFYQKLQFSSASDELAALAIATRHPEREALAETYSDLFNAYRYMDLYQHQAALERMEKILPRVERFRKVKLMPLLREQLKCLENIVNQGQREEFENLCDLYHNVLRRFKMEQYIDCLNRFKRIYEGSLYYVARDELGIPRPESRLNEQRIPPEVNRHLERDREYIKSYRIPFIYQQVKGKRLIPERLEQQMNALSRDRNYTINNHGMRSVPREDARRAVELLDQLLAHIFPG